MTSECGYQGCGRPLRAKGWCGLHYMRWRAHGSPDVVIPPRSNWAGVAPEEHPRWLGENIGYASAHARIKCIRGSAKDQSCSYCGKRATSWAYDHTDPNEKVGPNPRGHMCVYSADPAHYIPLCGSCHSTFDRGHRLANNPI